MTKSKGRRKRVTPIPTWGIFASYQTDAGNVVCLIASPRFGCTTTLRPHRALRFTTRKKAEAHRLKLLKAREKSPEPLRYRCLTVQQLTLDEIRKSRTQHKRHLSDVQEATRRDPGFPDPGPLDRDERGGDDGRPGEAQEGQEGPSGRRLWFDGPASD